MKKLSYDSFAETKHLLISPYKLRKVADVIRNKPVDIALQILKCMPQKGADIIYKTLYSAYSNAKNKSNIDSSALIIKDVCVNEGSRHKRFRARARGRAFSIIRRTSHIKIGLVNKTGVHNGTKN